MPGTGLGMADEKSTPIDAAPRSAAAAATSPVPEHRSSTFVPAATLAASSSGSTNCALARAKFALYSAAARCQPACSKARTASGSKVVFIPAFDRWQGPIADHQKLVLI